MHVVVNHFSLKEGIDWSGLESTVEKFQDDVSKLRPEFRGVSLLRVDDTKAIFLVFFNSLESLNDISRNIAAPWFAEYVQQYLDGAVDRQVGEIVAGYMK